MAPHERNRSNRSLKGTIISVIAIIVGIVACTVSITAGLDIRCRADIDHWLPIYPDSEVVAVRQRGFFRERASGVTEIVYHSDDDPVTVRGWYRDYRREITSGQYNEGNANSAMRGMSTTRYQVIDDPDGNGSRIIQTSECAYN